MVASVMTSFLNLCFAVRLCRLKLVFESVLERGRRQRLIVCTDNAGVSGA